MAKIDRVEDLPEWFDLEKYRGCEAFGAVEWHSELSRRSRLFNLLKGLREVTDSFKQSIRIDEISYLADSIRQSPIDSSPLFVYASPLRQPVKSINVHDLAMQAYRDEVASNNGLCHPDMGNRWMAISDPEYHSKQILETVIKPIEINFYLPNTLPDAVIQVDLGASDAVLKESFAAWLKEARSHQQSGSRGPSKSLYERWARYGLLPYLDLLIWTMETYTHIPLRVMSEAVGYSKGESSFSKTVVPLTAELMRDLSELQALAAVEAAARTPAGEETLES